MKQPHLLSILLMVAMTGGALLGYLVLKTNRWNCASPWRLWLQVS